ncbi:MAG: hypothetical protein GY861_13665 [bacterium]|nr:hypothetical protein [bacterium]
MKIYMNRDFFKRVAAKILNLHHMMLSTEELNKWKFEKIASLLLVEIANIPERDILK